MTKWKLDAVSPIRKCHRRMCPSPAGEVRDTESRDLLAGAVVAHGVEQAGLRTPLHRRVVLRGSDGLVRVAHLSQRGK